MKKTGEIQPNKEIFERLPKLPDLATTEEEMVECVLAAEASGMDGRLFQLYTLFVLYQDVGRKVISEILERQLETRTCCV